jgi:hypothetical protein
MTRDEVQVALKNPTGNIIKNAATLESDKLQRIVAIAAAAAATTSFASTDGVQAAVASAASPPPLEFYTW